MKILGVDFGTKIIGLAIAEEGLVEPYREVKSLFKEIEEICRWEKIEKIVVGISEGKSAILAKKFAQRLANLTGLPVEFADETLTTHEALVKMKTVGKRWRKKPNAIAAALILERYLEAH